MLDITSDSPFESKKINSFDEITPQNLLMVHFDNHLPVNGQIQSPYDAVGLVRNTVHFALNHAVVNPLGAGGLKGWTEYKYAIYTPMDKAIEINNPIGGKYNDFIFDGSVNIPEGSFIYVQNPEIEAGKLKLSSAEELTGAKGVYLIEGSKSPYDVADDLCEFLGYSNLKDMHAKIVGTNRQVVNIANDMETLLEIAKKLESGELSLEDYMASLGIDASSINADTIEKNMQADENWSKTWTAFSEANGFKDIQYNLTPYKIIEKIVQLIDLLSYKNQDWQEYREFALEELDKVLQYKDYKIDFIDLDVFREIILSSDTPSQALAQLKERLNISNCIVESREFSDEEYDELLKQASIPFEEDDFLRWNY